MGWLGQRILAGFWTLLALSILFYGNGETDMVTLVLYSDKLNRRVACGLGHSLLLECILSH